MKKLIVLLTFLISFAASFGRAYYVSSSLGNDANTAIQAQSQSTPWKSISKINSSMATFVAGDSILLKAGDTFSGAVVWTKTGTATAHIYFGSYGIGERPIITSLTPISSWKSIGGGVWQSNSALTVQGLAIVVKDDEPQRLGRWPNIDAANGGYVKVGSSTWDTSLKRGSVTASALSGAPTLNWAGADIILRTRRWILARDSVTSETVSSGVYTLKYQSDDIYDIDPNWGFWIQNHVSTLDKNYEWYYKQSTGEFKMFLSGSTPPSGIQVATQNTLLKTGGTSPSSVNYVDVEGIEFKGANGTTIDIDAANWTFTDVKVRLSGNNGIEVSRPNCKIYNSDVDWSLNNGVYLGYNGNDCGLFDTKINHSGNLAGMSPNKDNYNGVTTRAQRDTVMNCWILNSGKSGIRVGSYNGIKALNNWVDSSNLVVHDNGAIYVFGTPQDGSTVNTGITIANNIITNTIGAPYGTLDSARFPCHLAIPLYIDARFTGAEVYGNTAVGGARSLFMNFNCKNMNFHDNTAIGGFEYAVYLNVGKSSEGHTSMASTNKLLNNIFFSDTPGPEASFYEYQGTIKLESFGQMNGNYYFRPSDTTNGHMRDSTINRHFFEFRQKHPTLETTGHSTNIKLTNPADVMLIYNPTKCDSTFDLDATYADVFGNSYSTSVTLTPYTSKILMKTGASVNPLPVIPRGRINHINTQLN